MFFNFELKIKLIFIFWKYRIWSLKRKTRVCRPGFLEIAISGEHANAHQYSRKKIYFNFFSLLYQKKIRGLVIKITEAVNV